MRYYLVYGFLKDNTDCALTLWKQLSIVHTYLVQSSMRRPSDKGKKQCVPGRNAEQVLVQKLLASIRRVLKGRGGEDLSSQWPKFLPPLAD